MAEHRRMQERVWAERETIRREYEVERLAVDAIGRRHCTSRRQVELVLRRMGVPARPPARRGVLPGYKCADRRERCRKCGSLRSYEEPRGEWCDDLKLCGWCMRQAGFWPDVPRVWGQSGTGETVIA